MHEFIIDANLPFRISKWQTDQFEHVLNIRLKQIMQGIPPKVIHIKLGNLKLKEFEKLIETCWAEAAQLIKNHSLVNIFCDTIEAMK